MTNVFALRPGVRPLTRTARILRALADQWDVYRRYVRAGKEVEALFALSDETLATRGLERAGIGRMVLEKHGIAAGSSLSENRTERP